MSKKPALVLTLLFALLPLAANALGLGEIKLNSALNQPLSADIPIVGAVPDEIGSLHVKLASVQQFQQAGIPMSDALSQLQFQVMQGSNGSAHVHISSSKPFREPFLDVLVDATWDNGELIREYTVFVNPPNFESTAQAPTAPSQAAAAVPPPAAAVTPAPTPPPPPAAPPTPAAPTAAPVSSAPAALGRNYGPIRRGETLSGIARSLRPEGVTLNQMMIAIYRANPGVFMHNINLMKAGYVLRIPSLTDIQAVSVAQANSEVRTQVATWRSRRALAAAPKAPASTAAQPSLQLVAPSSAAKTAENQVPGAGKAGTGTAKQTANAARPSATAASAAAAAASAAHAPIIVPSNNLAAVQGQAAKENQPPAAAKTTPLPAEKPTVTKPLPRKQITAPVQPAESGGLLSSVINPYVIILVIIVIVLIIIGIIMKKRRSGGTAPVGHKPIKSKLASKTAPAVKEEWGSVEQAETPTATAASAAAQSATAPGLKPDESDPLAEADFHMAYGLYDQAAEVLKKALQQDPGRRDLEKKLLEVYFTAGDRTNFVQTARRLRQQMGDAPGTEWENVAIMGRQIAADEPLFSGAGTAGASVDIPLESGGTGTAVGTDLDPLAGAFAGVRPVTLPSEAAPAATVVDNSLDFSLPDIEPTPVRSRPAAAPKPAAPQAEALKLEPMPVAEKKPAAKVGVTTVTADFGTDSQVEFDKALKELSDFVNTNVPPQEESTRSGAALSLAADAEMLDERAARPGGGEETTGLNEIGTKLDLARAYLDMGDNDGAKNILEEVLAEGDARQKQEAQKLMRQLA